MNNDINNLEPTPPAPFINLPPATKYFLLLLLLIHAGLSLLLSQAQQDWVYTHFGFVAGAYTGHAPFTLFALAAPFTYMLLHGSWAHVLINGAMLMAFGAGVERWLGGGRMLLFGAACGLASIAVQFALNPTTLDPVIGASGALSGLFAAILVLMHEQGLTSRGRFGLWPLIILWVVVSVVFGYTGAPDGSAIAWAAHIGGFAAGFLLLPLFRRRRHD